MRTSTVTSNDASLGRQLTLAQFISTTSSTGRQRHLRQPADPARRRGPALRPADLRPGAIERLGHLPAPVGRRGRLRRQDRLGRLARRGAQRPLRWFVGRQAGDTGTTPTPTRPRRRAPRRRRRRRRPRRAGSPDSAALSKALKDAQAAYVEGEAALKRKGDFAAYGQAQAELKDALERAVEPRRRARRPPQP